MFKLELHYGFKNLSKENWLNSDFYMFGKIIPPNNTVSQIEGEDWLNLILQPQLNNNIPEHIKALFEVSRGAMAYGYFFYPLCSLASEQFYRVAEAAIAEKCKQMEAPIGTNGFSRQLEWLIKNNVLKSDELIFWNAVKELRNITSHPDKNSIITPAMAYENIEQIAEAINNLFRIK